MGNCCDNSPETSNNRMLSHELASEKQQNVKIKKLLFLGAGGSGKSTIFKQLRQIHGNGWDEPYLRSFIPHVHAQLLEQMRLAVEWVAILAEQELGNDDDDEYKVADDFNPYSKLSPDAQKAAFTLTSIRQYNYEAADAIKTLWNEAFIKDIYENRATMKIEDTSAYFWDKIDEINSTEYVPSDNDILSVRVRTTGVKQQKFTIKNITFHIFDVGGQKSERKKWIHCFENVTALIFVVSLSCYDEVMFEDERTNSMVDSLELFETIANDRWFTKTSIILFLNKKDLFSEKLNDNKPITMCPDFGDYDGDTNSFEESTMYIKQIFTAKRKSKLGAKAVYSHLTCATDSNNVRKVFFDVQAIVIEGQLAAQAILSTVYDV